MVVARGGRVVDIAADVDLVWVVASRSRVRNVASDGLVVARRIRIVGVAASPRRDLWIRSLIAGRFGVLRIASNERFLHLRLKVAR